VGTVAPSCTAAGHSCMHRAVPQVTAAAGGHRVAACIAQCRRAQLLRVARALSAACAAADRNVRAGGGAAQCSHHLAQCLDVLRARRAPFGWLSRHRWLHTLRHILWRRPDTTGWAQQPPAHIGGRGLASRRLCGIPVCAVLPCSLLRHLPRTGALVPASSVSPANRHGWSIGSKAVPARSCGVSRANTRSLRLARTRAVRAHAHGTHACRLA
jgi:hypothetical protein